MERFIRHDLFEITQASFVKDPSTISWIYFDALNLGHPDYTGEVLPNVFNADGSPLTQRFDGSRYLRWDHGLNRMVVDTQLAGEQDSDNFAVLQAFLVHALTDCVARGTTEYFLALSSHGGGFAGFGWDDHERRHRRRRLGPQSNQSIRDAIQSALASVTGAPSQLDVLGFDACLMQAMGAVDDFKDVTRYFLASEATEPGHGKSCFSLATLLFFQRYFYPCLPVVSSLVGWAYNELTVVGSARDLAVEVVNTFAFSVQDYGYHAQPKTLAVIETSAFDAFRTAWESLCAEMTAILLAGNDPDFHSNLQRARGSAVSFSGYLDHPSDKVKSAMDIGTFLAVFRSLCSVDPSSPLFTYLNIAQASYDDMFVERQVGPGTSAATGMHVTWVSKPVYTEFSDYFDAIIFGDAPLISETPNYEAFLRTYYSTDTPSISTGSSVCSVSTAASRSQTDPSELLIDPEISFPSGRTVITSEIVQTVDFAFVEYGVDVSNLLDDESRRLEFLDAIRQRKLRREWISSQPQEQSASSLSRTKRPRRHRRRASQVSSHRKAQEEEDYYYIYGGDVAVDYAGAEITASWDRNFYYLLYRDTLEPVYVFDDGDGLKSIPACYFGPANPISADDIPLFTTAEDAKISLGCEDAYLTFSTSQDSDGNLGLYVFRDDVLSQISPNSGGQVVPIVYVSLSVNGNFVDELLGGFQTSIIPWTDQGAVTVIAVNEDENLEIYGSNVGFMQAFAFDDDLDLEDGRYFSYTVGGSGGNGGGSGSRASSSSLWTCTVCLCAFLALFMAVTI